MIARAALGRHAGHHQIRLIPGVSAIGGHDPGLDHHTAGRFQPIADVAGEIGDDRAVRLDRRRHRADPPVEKLVTGIGAVIHSRNAARLMRSSAGSAMHEG